MTEASPSVYTARIKASQHRLWKNRTPLLGSLDIELTERCNNDCIHCCINLPVDDAKARLRELNAAQVQDILTQAADLGALWVRFTGGEPLLREDFVDLYIFARRLGLKVLLFTNARLITKEIAQLFSRIPPLEKIEVTVYGMQPMSYDAVTRVRGAYHEFRRGIALLLEYNVPFVVKGVVLPANRGEIDDFEAWAATFPAMDGPPGYALFLEKRGRRDAPAKNRLIESLRLTPDDGMAIISRQHKIYRKWAREFCGKFLAPPGDQLFVCGAGNAPCVDAYGVLQPCLPLRHPEMAYSLKNGGLREALANFFPGLRQHQARNPDYLARCARCFLMGLCEQCPAKSWAEHGTLDTPVEYLCRMAHVQARDLGLLHVGERAWEVKDWKARIRHI
jgi:radical SAM protein with 4Fe4S-binding SPASM domain